MFKALFSNVSSSAACESSINLILNKLRKIELTNSGATNPRRGKSLNNFIDHRFHHLYLPSGNHESVYNYIHFIYYVFCQFKVYSFLIGIISADFSLLLVKNKAYNDLNWINTSVSLCLTHIRRCGVLSTDRHDHNFAPWFLVDFN